MHAHNEFPQFQPNKSDGAEKADQQLNPFPNKPWNLCVCSRSLLKTLWEKE